MKYDTLIARIPGCGCIIGIAALRFKTETIYDRRNNLATIAEWLSEGYDLETTTTEEGRAAIKAQFGCEHDKSHLKAESPLQLLLATMKTMDYRYDRELPCIIDDCAEKIAEYEQDLEAERNDDDRPLLAIAEQRKDA